VAVLYNRQSLCLEDIAFGKYLLWRTGSKSVILSTMSKLSQSAPSTVDANLKQFYDQFRVVKFKKDELIFLANAEPTYAYAVRSGFVRTFSYTDTNDERSISFVLRNEMLPIAWIYTKSSTALFNYVAHTDCELYEIDRTKYHDFLVHKPELAYTMLVHSINDTVAKKLQILALAQATAERKILHTFNYFSIRYGSNLLQDIIVIKIPLTQKDIAGFTGLTRETVTNIIIKLKQQGIISVKKRLYTVHTEKLRQQIEAETEIPNLS